VQCFLAAVASLSAEFDLMEPETKAEGDSSLIPT
jgi:hypothetical protein